MPSKTLILALVLSTMAFAGRALAQTPATNPPSMPPVVEAVPTDYELGPGDGLSVHVTGVREFDQNIRVSNSGRIRVPYVGIVFAAGKTTLELEREIAQKIRDQELVNEPMVRVQVDQHRARPVHIVGEVTTPGQFVIGGEMYLLDLITRAGGLTPGADQTGMLYRPITTRPSVTARITVGPPPTDAGSRQVVEGQAGVSPSDAQVIPIDLDDLKDGKRPDLNIPLQGGDVFYVPRRQGRTVYIIGNVTTPGAYSLPRRGTVSAAQAITYAGGPLKTAKNGAAFLMRYDEGGAREAIPIDFFEIIKGKKPDIPIKADDIIFIPMSAGKTIATNLLDQIPRLIQQFVIF